MILLKHTLSSILVLLGACDRAAESGPSASVAVDHGAPSASAARSDEADGVSAPTTIPSASPPTSGERMASRVADRAKARRDPGVAKTVYVCPMHPEVTSETPGLCPKCNMKLEPKPAAAEVRRAEGRQDLSNSP